MRASARIFPFISKGRDDFADVLAALHAGVGGSGVLELKVESITGFTAPAAINFITLVSITWAIAALPAIARVRNVEPVCTSRLNIKRRKSTMARGEV